MAEREPTDIEDQALNVYHFWFCKMATNPEKDRSLERAFERHLNGLFTVLKETLPDAAHEAIDDARKRLSGELPKL